MTPFPRIVRPHYALIAAALLMPALSLGGCSKAVVTAPTSKAEDARAIAAVEAAQQRLPPVNFVTLQPIPASDGQPCAFNFSASDSPPVFRFGADAGRVMIDGDVKTFAVDHGSIEIYPGVRQEYDSTEFSLQLQHDVDDADNRGYAGRWPAKLTIKDRYERLVLLGMGVVTCGAKARASDARGSDRSR